MYVGKSFHLSFRYFILYSVISHAVFILLSFGCVVGMCSSCCNLILVRAFPEWLSGTKHGCAHPAPCVHPRYVYSVLRAYERFDKADVTTDV